MKSLPNCSPILSRPRTGSVVTLLFGLVSLSLSGSCASSSPVTASSTSLAPKATIAMCAAVAPWPSEPGSSAAVAVVELLQQTMDSDPTAGSLWFDSTQGVVNISFTRDEQAKGEVIAPQILPWKLNVTHADFSHAELLSAQQALTRSLPVAVSLKSVESLGIDERRNRVVIHLLDLSAPVVDAVTEAVGPQPPAVCIDPVQGTHAFPA